VRAPPPRDLLFYAVFGLLTLLAAAPFWRTTLLPMQDYPHFLVFVRAFRDLRDPASPFFGTYTTGFPLSPVVLPMLVTRALGAVMPLETAGKVLWTLYAVSLPLASLDLLRVLGRDRWCVLLVFPLVLSYWVIGGFFAFATGSPLLVLGLSLGVRWLEARRLSHGLGLAAVAAALHLWHALLFAQLLFDFGVLWLLMRGAGLRDRARALLPLVPSLLLFAAWLLATVGGRSQGAAAAWPPMADNIPRFFEYIGAIVAEAPAVTALFALLLLAGALARPELRPGPSALGIQNPFALLSLLAVGCYVVFPSTCFGVEGINNRQPWIAALLFVFGWSLPAGRLPRASLLTVLAAGGALVLGALGRRFHAFDRETSGASRLLDRLEPGSTLLAPIGSGSTEAFPGKPLVALGLYATVRHGGLPNSSFAGYDVNFIRYVNGKNPMPGLGAGWLENPSLRRFDYVLYRGSVTPLAGRASVLRLIGQDGAWSLFRVCGSRALPSCATAPR